MLQSSDHVFKHSLWSHMNLCSASIQLNVKHTSSKGAARYNGEQAGVQAELE